MSQDGPEAGRAYSLERTRYGDRWHVDSEGYLHAGRGSSYVEGLTITSGDRSDR